VTTEAANAIDSGGSGTLTWAPCDDPDADDETLECATLAVPLDYGAPDGSTIDLALVRVPAAGDREGAVLFNPGGPGGSGFEYIAQGGPTIATALGLDGLDLIGFDPRGVDRSNGIRCVDDATQDRFLYLDDTPDTPEEQALLDEADGMFVDGCLTNYGNTLRHYSTENTARDMDRIRAALGDEQISFLGISYGTYLGAVYATLFPERVRAMVLDSAYEPNGDTIEQQYETQLVGFEHAFDNWVAWCQAEPTCAFTSPDVGARWDALLQQLDDSPLTGDDGRLANQSTMDTATAASLYSESEWAVLAAALAGAEAGDPAGILALADAYSGRNPDGTFDTMFQSSAVIRCASGLDQQPPPDPEALAARLREAAPRFGKTITADDLVSDTDECGELVGDVTAFEIGYAGAGPIVVVGGTNDPATPLRWAQEMAVAMGPAARLVTFTGEGHGQLLVSTCVTDIEATLLTRLELPADGTVCDPDPPVGRPDWWDDVPTPEGMSAPAPLPALAGALGVTPALGYAEFRTTRLSAIEAADAYAALLGDAGFTELGRQELPLPDNVQDAWIAPNGDLLAVVALGPGALTGDELRGATSEVPPGTTVVLLIYLPQ
jgi:pimeloyl-ACP methyl ester carboxylesterase